MRESRNDTIKISVRIMVAWWCALIMSLWSGDGKPAHKAQIEV